MVPWSDPNFISYSSVCYLFFHPGNESAPRYLMLGVLSQYPAVAKQRRLVAAAEADGEPWTVCPLQCQLRNLISGHHLYISATEPWIVSSTLLAFPFSFSCMTGGSVLSTRIPSPLCFPPFPFRKQFCKISYPFLLASLDSLY